MELMRTECSKIGRGRVGNGSCFAANCSQTVISFFKVFCLFDFLCGVTLKTIPSFGISCHYTADFKCAKVLHINHLCFHMTFKYSNST